MKTLLSAFRLLTVLTVLTGLLYPFAVWAVGRTFFRDQAEGSLVHREGRLVGSTLLGQKTVDPRYFSPRPSAGDYATVASGASNLAWTNTKLVSAVAERRMALGGASPLPPDLLTASGSGLDPHLSADAVLAQLPAVSRARQLNENPQHALLELIARLTEGGHITPIRVNILQLNLALDAAFPPP